MMMNKCLSAACAALMMSSATVHAQATEVGIGYSGWTGFGPLTLAKEAGIFEKNGLDVTLQKIPQASRNLALASGDIQCAATTVETWIIWNANNVPVTQIFQLDKSFGADGMAVRGDVEEIADLEGKNVAASAPGTSPYFLLAWMLDKNGLSIDDVNVVNLEPGPAAQAFVAGQNEAVMTYEPYLSTIREAPDSGKIIATTLDYPAVLDTFGCTPEFLESNAETASALADSYYEALEMIASDREEAYEIMGADVDQTAEQFGASAEYLEWQDREAARAFFKDEFLTFAEEASALLMKMGLIREVPDPATLFDDRFIQ